MKTLIKNGRIAGYSGMFTGDIMINNGVISEIGMDIKKDCDALIDAGGKLVIPGGIDAHTHLNIHVGDNIASDDFYTGTIAAACGGTTCIIDHMGFGPKGCNLHHQVGIYHGYADGNAVIDYGFHGVIQDVNSSIIDEMDSIVYDEGIPSFKVYLTYDYKASDADVIKVMEKIRELKGILAVHCENDSIISFLRKKFISEGKIAPIYHAESRPPECEGEAINRMIYMSCIAHNAPLYIVHLTTSYGLSHIKDAKNKGRRVFAETCPQYLLLDEDKYNEPDNEGLKYIMSPPLRNKSNQEHLWEGIRKGYIDVVATDHCPFLFSKEKQLGLNDFTKCPNGAPGIEERMPLMFSEGVMKGRISLQKFIDVCCMNPAKLFGLYPEKGVIAPSSDADLTIIDPDKEVTLTRSILHSRCDYTAYEGFKLRGYPVMTISRGEVVMKDGEFTGNRGRGLFIKRKTGEYNV